MSISKELVRGLLEINAIKIQPSEPFTWASGWQSPIYCDNRLSLSYPHLRQLIKEGLKALRDDWDNVDVIVGVATAGIPHGALLADLLEKPFAYVRSKAKGHGRQNQIEGVIRPGQNVVLIEDLISTGGSLIKAAQPLKDLGVNILEALAIFTYGFEKAVDNMAEAQIPFQTISDYGRLLDEALSMSYITAEDLNTLKAWRLDPGNWKSA